MSLEKICCANYSCENILTQFELERISFKFTKWIFCRKCRFYRNNIDVINCRKCGNRMENNGKVVCNDCKKIRITQTRHRIWSEKKQ